ncbi:hypothetical protein CEXT_312901 [Caerostris extrusa]|uniref:Uncharacterized protein n=1 Tax=Caerostris extrusa TaxID=172846 RepID=A0AAV4S5U1_CAEEX|nr:hypothetical protein CEXT_312901 [Caerostris extrusa]
MIIKSLPYFVPLQPRKYSPKKNIFYHFFEGDPYPAQNIFLTRPGRAHTPKSAGPNPFNAPHLSLRSVPFQLCRKVLAEKVLVEGHVSLVVSHWAGGSRRAIGQ